MKKKLFSHGLFSMALLLIGCTASFPLSSDASRASVPTAAMPQAVPDEDSLAGIGPNQPLTAAECSATLTPGANIQDAIDAVRDHTTPYVLCLRPGIYVGGMNGDTTYEPNRDLGDTEIGPETGGEWWNRNDDGPYYGNIVIKNRQNFTLRGLAENGERAQILAIPNDEIYPPEEAAPQDQHPNDKAILIKIVNGDNITLENLTIDGFYYPTAPDMATKIAVLNRLVWLQNTTNSRVIHNIIKNAGGECVRIKANSRENEIAYNTIHGCGYYQFKVQPLERLHKNGEGIYIGTDPYQIRANQVNKSAYWGLEWNSITDGSANNLIHHNDIFPGAQDDLAPPPQNGLLPGVAVDDGYGNECIDAKEDFEDVGRLVQLPGVTEPQRINNVIRDNVCQGQHDEDSGALDARNSNNLFEHNRVTGVVRGAAMRLGGGAPKPTLVEPMPSDPVKGCFGAIINTQKWQALNNRIRKNVFESYYNEEGDFNGRGGYAASDCDDRVDCSDPANPQTVLENCGPQKILHVVKTFDWSDFPMEKQASGSGVCGNVANLQGATDWGTRVYKDESRPVEFSREAAAALNQPQCAQDENNFVDNEPPGPRGCVGYACADDEAPTPGMLNLRNFLPLIWARE